MKLKFQVQGSDEANIYDVTFEKIGDNLRAYCTCQAGKKGSCCKHRFSLMDGEISKLVGDNHNDLIILQKMLEGTDLETAYKIFIRADKECEAAKSSREKASKNLAKAMHG